MVISLPYARELSDEVLEALRLRAVHGFQLGFTETELADLLGVCRETVCRWWSAYADGGLDVFAPRRYRMTHRFQTRSVRFGASAAEYDGQGIPDCGPVAGA